MYSVMQTEEFIMPGGHASHKGTSAKPIELSRGEILIADYDMVKGYTNGIEEDYRKLGHFGKSGGEGFV
ncbi:hypothetical protein AMR41_24845 [Hapalosiphon sp. MRB220]|nr:hypothetical protein AMR41_24845 [Hapalosiphon sp. MRB220]